MRKIKSNEWESGLNEKKISEDAGLSIVKKEKRCRILMTLAKDIKAIKLYYL